MAIQVRRGNESDFDASKMLPGEWAVSLDTRYVRMCFAPGIVLRMSTYDAFEADMAQIQAILAECRNIQSAVQRIQTEVNSKASLTVEYANDAKESADRAYSEAERAKIYADNAEAVTGVQIATKDRAGLIKGGNNHIAEDGTLMLITTTDSTTQPNSHAGREMVLEIGGVMEQDSTAGNQLFDASTVNVAVGGLNSSGDNYTTENFIRVYFFTASGDITITCDLPIYRVCWYEGYATGYIGAVTKENGVNQLTLSLPTEATHIRTAFLNTDTQTTSNIQKVKDTLMVNSGTTALPWEKYSGGIPAPNPSYSMPIKNSKVKGIRTHWKNFINQACVPLANTEKHFLKAGTYTVSKDESEASGAWYLSAYDSDNNIITKSAITVQSYQLNSSGEYWYGGTNSKNSTFTISTDCYVKIGALNGSGNTYLMLNKGITAEPYEPYTESSYTFSQPIDLYGKDGVQDVITAKPIKRRFAKRVFNGSEAWGVSGSVEKRYVVTIADAFPNQAPLCTHAVAKTGNDVNLCFINSTKSFYINTDFATLEEWKAHLASKPMEVVYYLAEEVVEALPIADQIGLNSLQTYDGITYVEFIYDELEPTFKGKYGTSEVGGMTLESLLVARNNELRLAAVENAVVNNI